MNSFYYLIDQHFSAIIGVVGTLLGVLLGALINRFSRSGRVRFYVNNIEYDYGGLSDGYGGYIPNDSFTSETNSISINIELDIINTSEYSKKILRDIKFVFVGKEFNKTQYINDISTGRFYILLYGKLMT